MLYQEIIKLLTENGAQEFQPLLIALVRYYAEESVVLDYIFQNVKLTTEDLENINKLRSDISLIDQLRDESMKTKLIEYSSRY